MADLFAASDLAGLPGAPFSDAVAQQAGEAIRNICGWHIAPAVPETVTVTSNGGQYLFVDTMKLTAVTEVRDVTGGGSTVLTGWTFNHLGHIFRRSGWPRCDRTIELDIVHGYDECPPELLGEGARIARSLSNTRLASQKSLGSGSISFESSSGGTTAAPSVLDKYTLTVI